MTGVAISGAAGRLGRVAAEAVDAAPDLSLVGLYAPGHAGERIAGHPASGEPRCVDQAEIVLEVTRPDVVMANLEMWKTKNKHVVVGTSGFDDARLRTVESLWGDGTTGCMIVPNFSIGAVLMMRFAEMAARHFRAAEVVELHHDRKADAPSGTATSTAARIGSAAPDQRRHVVSTETVPGARGGSVSGVPVHSIRLPGLLAHQEVLFGNPGEVLTIRHDSTDRASFVPGILLALRHVAGAPGVTVGLDRLI